MGYYLNYLTTIVSLVLFNILLQLRMMAGKPRSLGNVLVHEVDCSS